MGFGKKVIALTGCIVFLLAGLQTLTAQEMILLLPSLDKKKNELLIAKWLDIKGMKYSVITSDKDPTNKWLKVTYTFEGIPELKMYVDNYKTNDNESRIAIESWPKLGNYPEGSAKRRAMLELINQVHLKKWLPQRIYITKKGGIKMESAFNIPGRDTPIHPEMIRDTIRSTASVWKYFYREWFKRDIANK